MDNKLVRLLYVLVIGLLFVAFVGFGLAAFYSAPKSPEYPLELSYPAPVKDGNTDAAQIEKQKEFNAQQKTYGSKMSDYNLLASIILIAIAVIVLAVSMLLSLENMAVIGDGLTLGGVFTLLYGLGRGMAVMDDRYRFVAVTVGLVVIVGLAYLKFIKPKKAPGVAPL